MNGFGPWWWPVSLRDALTSRLSRWFVSASWEKHDIGYSHGYPSRSECDRKFLSAMLFDAAISGPVWRMMVCTFLAWVFWAAVRLGGWASYGRGRNV